MRNWRIYLFRRACSNLQTSWYGLQRHQSFLIKPIHGLLWLFSLLSKLIVKVRNLAYKTHVFRAWDVQPTIISVGNISMGGSGKTPTVLMICEQLKKMDISTAILSRGYHSTLEKNKRSTLCSHNGPLFSWREMGDEPYLLACRLPECSVWVGRNRVESAKKAFQNGAKVCVLDDGLQHRKLKRDFEVITMQSQDLSSKMHFFPRGYLRDEINRLKEADLILLQNVSNDEEFSFLQSCLRKYTEAPSVGIQYEIEKVCDQQGNCFSSINNKAVGAFCGIARPELFFSSIKRLGAVLIDSIAVGDHVDLSVSEIEQYANRCRDKGAQYLICTEKDWVKLSINHRFSLPILFLKLKLKIVSGNEHWKIFIEKISNKLNNEAV